jgi:hypothetical protein
MFTLTPVWIFQKQDMGASFNGDPVKLQFEDNLGIQCAWTGTPTGIVTVQVSLDYDNLGWQTMIFSPTPSQPSGSAGNNWFEINQSPAAWVRVIYTRTSGTGLFSAKIALKSV